VTFVSARRCHGGVGICGRRRGSCLPFLLKLVLTIEPVVLAAVPGDPSPVPSDPPPVPSDPPPVPSEFPVVMPVVEFPGGVPVDEVPADPVIDEAPMEPAEEPPAAPPPAAKAPLPDVAKPAANINVVIFMDILLRGRRIRRATAGRSGLSGKRAAPAGSSTEKGLSWRRHQQFAVVS